MKEDWTSKVGLVLLFLMGRETLMFDVMLEFLNTFFYQGNKYLLWA
jgi:hypothetical protein